MAAPAGRANPEAPLCWRLYAFWLMAVLAGSANPEASLCWEPYAFWLMAALVLPVTTLHARHCQRLPFV